LLTAVRTTLHFRYRSGSLTGDAAPHFFSNSKCDKKKNKIICQNVRDHHWPHPVTNVREFPLETTGGMLSFASDRPLMAGAEHFDSC